MANPLDGVRAKIERAEQHLFNFEVGAAHFERGAYTTRIERDHTAGGIRLFAEATRPLAEPPAPLMLLAGEIAYQLRSALDHIAFLLAKDTPEGRREFPVFDTSNSYISEGARKIKGMSARATAIVESVQPYRRGESAEDAHEDTLWMLHRINITDKHQLIPGSLVIANNIRV